MTDRLFEESNEERIARLRRRFETGLEDFDRAFAEKDCELELVDGRLRQALRVRGVDPGTGEAEGS